MTSKIVDSSVYDEGITFEILEKLWRGRLIRSRQCLSYANLLQTAIEGYEEEVINEELIDKIANYDNYEIPAKIKYMIDFVKDLLVKNNKDVAPLFYCFFKIKIRTLISLV